VNGGARLALFAAASVALFAGAAGAGRAIDLDAGQSNAHGAGDGHASVGGHAAAAAAEDASAAGIAGDGLRLVTTNREVESGRESPFAFRIVDDRGVALEDFDITHARRMHLLVVRRDLTGYQHLHPTRAPDGTWTVPLRLDEAGVYRVFADFSSGGDRITLGTDVVVPGSFQPHELPAPATTARSGGYEVRLDDESGGGGRVEFTVLRGGAPVGDLEPYLGALGHLVTLRDGDLAFLHVHPAGDATSAGRIAFDVEYPSQGRYRLFLQFKHAGRVQTVEFTQEVGP